MRLLLYLIDHVFVNAGSMLIQSLFVVLLARLELLFVLSQRQISTALCIFLQCHLLLKAES